ncbi:MAG: bifunctional proline dehydrogenase/L-glutamate gamma-semialdehyde dehydrogenase PutA, partial [Pseudomonadota bacterium]
LLRVPDIETIDALIEDKIAPSAWGQHLGRSSSSLVNASTWALLFTGKVLDDDGAKGAVAILQGAIKRLGEPVIRVAALQAMKILGRQFVLGQTIDDALHRAKKMEEKGYTYSYDMLGEAAMTAVDAEGFYKSYRHAILALGREAKAASVRENPGISIKLSALHPRYDALQKERVMSELVPRVLRLVILARERNIGINIDAEEAERLDLSLDVIEEVLRSIEPSPWDGFGVVVQAYGKRASAVIDWLYALSKDTGHHLMVRLVKGAYWDSEIKLAQTEGVSAFPVFTRKSATDAAYLCSARQILSYTDRIYPQFATHNAHTVAAIVEAAGPGQQYEFQRLHGMGEGLHDLVQQEENTSCRIYAPVGVHRDLLAYLVRRLLENGANSSFVNQLLDKEIPPKDVTADPFDTLKDEKSSKLETIKKPCDLFAPQRKNSLGWDLRNATVLKEVEAGRSVFASAQWAAVPIVDGKTGGGETAIVQNPSDPSEPVGTVVEADAGTVEEAISTAQPWAASPCERAAVLGRAADLYEEHYLEIAAILTREAGKTLVDAELEVREAVDFLRYYATEGERYGDRQPRGIFSCISPWNFPLAIFTGQIAAALAAGNAVLAKPAETTPIIAWYAVKLLHRAGVPTRSLHLLPGAGGVVGAALTSDPRISGVCFTGSTATAQQIHRTMATHLHPSAPLIAETGGLNAMLVDSTALPEQAIRDVVASAFQSAGQRCSALRVLYIQEDVADTFLTMLFGAMDELSVASPWALDTDVGPVIDKNAQHAIGKYISDQAGKGRLLKQIEAPNKGFYVKPSVVRVAGIEEVEREIFGPVLHVATFKAEEIEDVVNAVNAKGFGLTFGMHSRIDDRVQEITEKIRVGNIYINRNQIGAVVGSQPFGGEGLSGTGPKAGGPHYLARFCASEQYESAVVPGASVSQSSVQQAIDALPEPMGEVLSVLDLPGPTGESNRLSQLPRGRILCLGPTLSDVALQRQAAHDMGCATLAIAPGVSGPNAVDGVLELEHLSTLKRIDGVAFFAEEKMARLARCALADRDGPILPLFTEGNMRNLCMRERHLCIDTTAAGGNTALLAGTD